MQRKRITIQMQTPTIEHTATTKILKKNAGKNHSEIVDTG